MLTELRPARDVQAAAPSIFGAAAHRPSADPDRSRRDPADRVLQGSFAPQVETRPRRGGPGLTTGNAQIEGAAEPCDGGSGPDPGFDRSQDGGSRYSDAMTAARPAAPCPTDLRP